MRKQLKRFWPLILVVLVLLTWLGRPVLHVTWSLLRDVHDLPPVPAGFANDFSRLEETKVSEIVRVSFDHDQAEADLAEVLRRARRNGLRVSIAGARHSMGGHTIAPDGVVLDMLPFDRLQLDETNRVLHAQAGATWSQIIPFLDAKGLAVAVMQSDSSFSVGGSLSVNCHGWQHDHAPIASTVRSMRVMLADGSIRVCSREHDRELFSAVLGGYGLFGIILDADLEVVENERYRGESALISAEQLADSWQSLVSIEPKVGMAYARLSVASERFLAEAMITRFVREDGPIPALTPCQVRSLERAVFRGSVDSDYGKSLRWRAETSWQPDAEVVSRNSLMNTTVEDYVNGDRTRTDILQEYFIPMERWLDFLPRLRTSCEKHRPNLLNATVRSVKADADTILRYADCDQFAIVLFLDQRLGAEAEESMQAFTRDLIEEAIACGGRYYLPYRRHATLEQFHRCYPRAEEFFALKRRFDPDGLFDNKFAQTYGPHESAVRDTAR